MGLRKKVFRFVRTNAGENISKTYSRDAIRREGFVEVGPLARRDASKLRHPRTLLGLCTPITPCAVHPKPPN